MSEVNAIMALQAALTTPFLKSLFIFFARWLILVAAASSIGAYFVEREPNHRHAWKELFWSAGLAALFSIVLSTLIGRERPFVAYPAFVQLLMTAPSSPYSLPSMHAAVVWAWAMSAMRISRLGAPLWFITALLVSLGRVAVGVHFFSDVIGGALVGILAYTCVHWGHRLLRARTHV